MSYFKVERNLKAGFDEIISVATNKHIEKKIKENLKQVKITSILEFDITTHFFYLIFASNKQRHLCRRNKLYR